MAPASRHLPLPVEMDPDYDPETQLRSLTESEKIVDCHPSRGRRLFPQHHISTPTSASRYATNIRGFSHLETSPPSPSSDHLSGEHHNSNASSPSSVGSVGTINVRVSPTPDWPFPKVPKVRQDARAGPPCLTGSLPQSCSVGRPATPCNSPNRTFETSFSTPLYNDTPARGKLRWKSMAQFHKAGRRLRPRTLLQLPNGEKTPGDSEKNEDEPVPANEASRGNLPFELAPCQRSKSPEIATHPGLVPIEVHQDWGRQEDTYAVTKNQSRPNISAFDIATWDCSVELSDAVTVTDNRRLHVHHLAHLSVMMPKKKPYAEEVSLSFVVTNAFCNDHNRSLGLGRSSLLFKEDISQRGFFPREGADLVIVRDSCDLEKPLISCFVFTCPPPRDFVMASLPTFRPKEGRSLSRVVFITEPLPPLSMRTFIRDPLSSWKLCHHRVRDVTRYERIHLPRLYPAGFQDDVQIRILELDPVRFRALGESTLSSVLWKLDITVHRLLVEQMECRMSCFLEVGVATSVVSLVPHGWVPRYFIVSGRVATENVGECWMNEEGHIKIFKQAHIALGPTMVETYWQGPLKYDKDDGHSTDNPLLPGVADRKVLGGRLTCGANEEVVLPNRLEKRIRTYDPVDGTYTLLPTMDAGRRIRLEDVPEARSAKSRHVVFISPPVIPTPENTQLPGHTVLHPDAEMKMDHQRGWSHTANNVKGEALSPRHMLRALSLPSLVLLFLVPCFLLFIGHIRKGNNDSETTSWRDSTMGRDGGAQTFIDVADLEPLQSSVLAETCGKKVEKCDGWRDWIDVYVGGWKGCTM